jgi:hypothetical protein
MESVERTSPGSILKAVESAQGDGSGITPPTILIYTMDPNILGIFIHDTEFKQLLESLGFSVIIEDRNSINPLNSNSFTNISQFWLMNGDETGNQLSVLEESLILDAWRNGTEIVLAGRNAVNSVNTISNHFGVEFSGNVNTETNHSLVFANHPIWTNITSLYAESPLPSLIIEPTSQAVNLSFLPAMWTLHALFENETGKVFWESSSLHFKDDYIGIADNAQYISNLARYFQEPEITLQGLKNSSIVTDITPIKFQIVDDNLRSVQYNWNGGFNNSFDLNDSFGLFIISPPSTMGWNVLNLFVEDQWNHSKNLIFRFKQVVKSIPTSTSLPMIFIYSTDSTGAYYRDKYINETRTLLKNLGFNVTVGDKSTIPILNSSHFVNVSQFWIMNGGDGAPFTDTEKNLILNAWRNGTNLILAGDETSWYSNVNLIGKVFGVEYEGAYGFSNPQTPTFLEHPIWINVSTIYSDPTLPQLIIYPNSSAQALSTDSGYNQHVLFENNTGIVFLGSSFGNFMDEHINKYDNSEYVSNLARYLQAPKIHLFGANNNSVVTEKDQLSLEIVDDNLLNVSYNWNFSPNQTIDFPYNIPLPMVEGVNILHIYVVDQWNHSVHKFYYVNQSFHGQVVIDFNSTRFCNESSTTAVGWGRGRIHIPFNLTPQQNFIEISHAQDVFVYEDYVFVAAYDSGLAIFDISDPTAPSSPIYQELYPHSDGLGVYVTEDLAFIADGSGLAIINVSDPLHPSDIIGYQSTYGANDVFVIDGYAYIATDTAGLAVINITDPTSPGEPVYRDTSAMARDVYITGDFAYIATDTAGLAIINISDPNEPGQPIYCDTDDNAYGVYVYEGFAFVADDESGLVIINVTDPTTPGLPIYVPTTGDAHRVHVFGGYTFIAVKDSGIALIDISDPTNPSNLTYIDVNIIARRIFIHDNYLFATDNTGLTMFPLELIPPVMVQTNTLYNSNYYIQNVTLRVNQTINEDTSIIHFISTNGDTWVPLEVNETYSFSHNTFHDLYWRAVLDTEEVKGLSPVIYSVTIDFDIYYDQKPPEIALIDIQNDSIINPSIKIDLSIEDFTYKESWYSWDGNTNQSLADPFSLFPPAFEGYHWLTVYVNDSVGHLIRKRFRWWIDPPPTIIMLSDINNTVQKYGTVISFSVEDTDLDCVWYSWDISDVELFEAEWNVTTALTNGWHSLFVYANDTNGFMTTKYLYFYCDALAPSIELLEMYNNSVLSPSGKLDLNITDFSLDTIWFNWDDTLFQSLSSPFLINTSLQEGYHWLIVNANDSVGHISIKKFRFYINYPPRIELTVFSNNSIIFPSTQIPFEANDLTLSSVWYHWDSGENATSSLPITAINSSGWHTLVLYANDSWGLTTHHHYSFYILGSPLFEITQEPSIAYSGESFICSFTVTNQESISLNLTLWAYGLDDDVLQGNGSLIILAPGETQTIELTIKPKHASIHQLLISLYHGGEVYYQYTLEFNVDPQWMSPRFYIPFIILPILVFLLLAVISGVSFYFLRTRERIRQVFHKEFTSTEEPVSLSKVQSSIKAPSFMVNLGLSSDQNLIVTPDGNIISKKHLTQHIVQIISSSTGPLQLLDISIKYKFSMSQVLSIVNKALSEGIVNGKIIDNVFYPSTFIFQVSTFISNQSSGNLSSLFDKFQINQKIIDLAVKNLLESDESIFTIYLHPQQDIFQVIYISEWNNIVRRLSSSEGFIPGTIFPELTIYNWRSIFQNQKIPILSYGEKLFTIEGLQAYTPDHLDEITPIIQNLRRQLPQLSLSSRKQREIIQSFEQLLPIEPVHLPYYCQMDSAMIVKAQAAYVCVDCNRYICPSCYQGMLESRMVNCINCGGDLVERPALQIEVDIERVDHMSGHEFENFLEGLFRTQMYRVENIQSSGDHGVDLVIIKGETRTGVQAKRYKPSSKIGNKVLVTLKGGGYFHDCDKLMVVTTSFFTPKAREYAQKVGIELWDRNYLRRYLTKYNEHLQDISR